MWPRRRSELDNREQRWGKLDDYQWIVAHASDVQRCPDGRGRKKNSEGGAEAYLEVNVVAPALAHAKNR